MVATRILPEGTVLVQAAPSPFTEVPTYNPTNPPQVAVDRGK